MTPSREELEAGYKALPCIGMSWFRRLQELGVPPQVILEPEFLRQARVAFHTDLPLFDFADDADGDLVDVVIILARDELGSPSDFIAWAPKTNRVAGWYGVEPLLGADQLYAPRLCEPLMVFATVREWLIGERQGVVVIDPRRAKRVLNDVGTLAASSPAFGLRLRTFLHVAPTPIVVPSAADQKAA